VNKLRLIILAALVGVFAQSGFGGITATIVKSRSAKSDPVTLGKWHCNFSKCKDYAVKNKVPLIAVWSNGDACGHCVMFEESINSTVFKNWMKTSGCVFYFVYSGDGGDGAVDSDVFHWIRGNKNTSYPFVRIYWPKGKVDIATVGDTIDGKRDGATGGKNAVAYFKSKLSKYKPATPTAAYTGGRFDVGDVEDNRLEAEIGYTTHVTVNLSRTNTVVTTVSTNKLLTVYPDQSVVTNVLRWAAGDAATNVVVTIPKTSTTPGEQIELRLLNAAGNEVETSHITLVAEPGNSPKNPRWIGERTRETLDWGEWTMDIDAATNKVAAYNRAPMPLSARLQKKKAKAYTLLLIGGPLWCPDCVNAEEYVINTAAFRNWATNECRIACVAIDEPCFAYGYDGPTLLSEQTVWGKNGASYLARKMVDPVQAAEIRERNLFYVNNDTLHGGYCTPDNTGTDASGNTGKWKTGIPCLIVLRDDGSVAGRLFQFSNSTAALTTNATDAVVERLREIVAQDADRMEELNDSRFTTEETIGMRTNLTERTLSFSDVADVYRFDSTTQGKRIKVTINPGSRPFLKGTRLQAEIRRAVGSSTKVVASCSGAIDDADPLSCEAELSTNDTFLVVSYPTDDKSYSLDPQFALTNRNSTLCGYRLVTDFVVVPSEVTQRVVIPDAELQAWVQLASNRLYRVTGLDAEACKDMLSPDAAGEDFYRACVEGVVRLPFVSGQFECQAWEPGEVGFARASASVAEPSKGGESIYRIAVVRRGGVSGEARARVALDKARSSKLDGLFELDPAFDADLVWAEGEAGEKALAVKVLDNSFADGDQTLYFTLGEETFRLVLRDNDRKVPGRLAVAETVPALASAMTVYQRAGTNVLIGLARESGTSGTLAGTLTTSDGELDVTRFRWLNRDAAVQTAKLDIPDAAAGKKIVVTLTPGTGTSVDAARRKLSVKVLDAAAPGFAVDAKTVAGLRYLPIEPVEIALDAFATAATKIAKHAGGLPSGVTWRQDGGKLIVSGVPTKAGVFTAVFRASTGKTDGLTVAVTLDVVDPVVAGGGEGGGEPLNPTVAATRTIPDIPVYDALTNRLEGVLTLTLPRTGRASAKVRRPDGKTISLSAPNWSAIAPNGTLTACLTGTGGRVLTIAVGPDGAVSAELVDPEFPEGLVCEVPDAVWSAVRPATDFTGYYTVSLSRNDKGSGGAVHAAGDGYLTLKMNTTDAIRAGRFAFAGVLPNGRAVSGSAVLHARAWNDELEIWDVSLLPILAPGVADSLAGVVRLVPGAWDSTAADLTEDGKFCEGRCWYKRIRCQVKNDAIRSLVWRHASAVADVAGEVPLTAYGTYYVGTDDFATSCANALGSTALRFFTPAEVRSLAEADVWSTTQIVSAVTVKYAKATAKAKTKTNALTVGNAKKLTLSFDATSGLVTGSFKMAFEGRTVTLSCKGVVLPGWGNADCAACSMGGGGSEVLLRPFISGTAWFDDTFDYDDARGRARRCADRRSVPFSVGLIAGE